MDISCKAYGQKTFNAPSCRNAVNQVKGINEVKDEMEKIKRGTLTMCT